MGSKNTALELLPIGRAITPEARGYLSNIYRSIVETRGALTPVGGGKVPIGRCWT